VRLRRWFFIALTGCFLACSPVGKHPSETPRAELVRRKAELSKDPEVVGHWLLSELVSEGGTDRHARRARAELDRKTGGAMYAHLARGLDDVFHGKLRRVSDQFLHSLAAARDSSDVNAPLIAWFAAEQAANFRRSDPTLYERWKPFLLNAIREPRAIGWRARSKLVDLWQDEAWSEARKDVLEEGVLLHGCANELRLAGPFGRNVQMDITRSFAAEAPGPWPTNFPEEEGATEPPSIRETERHGCFIGASGRAPNGVYYAEAFFELERPKQVLLVAQGAYGIWVDDQRVLERDSRNWGSWLHFGALVALAPGRHRVVIRLAEANTSLRLLESDGRPLGLKTSTDQRRLYSIARPKLLPNANVLDRYLGQGKVLHEPEDDVVRYVAAMLANIEAQPDVANVLLEPLLARPNRASGPALSTAALFTRSDPIFSDSQRKDLVRELEERAAGRDARLWYPRLMLALSQVERSGLTEAIAAVSKLVDEFPEVPAILRELSKLYAELGWNAERSRTALELARRFPDDPLALEPAIGVLDAQGRAAEADALVERVQKLDPDLEVKLSRALERQDFPQALDELRRLAERRPQRKDEDLAERIYDVMVRAGNNAETWKKLEAAIKKNPKNERARLDFADAGMARGQKDALGRALLDAVQAGAPPGPLEDAIDLLEGMSELEPYRHRARDVIADYERSGKEQPGTAARVLDYAVVWVHADGSSRMLEHEIIRVQSAEAIAEMAEQEVKPGLTLHFRVIKKDGRFLEPEVVEGKPTLTLPHLEVGDYIETERIENQPGEGRGARYIGPRWYFREENIAYARSEFVILSPKSRPLSIETRNGVPAPVIEERGAVIVRRWRVDASPAAPVEPFGAPIVEFLPSVQTGWGITLERTVQAMSDAAFDPTPRDPRITRIAERIVVGVPPDKRAERARRLYRWVATNVEEGVESDGRRVIIGKNGNVWRAYIALCRALDIPVNYGVAKSRLSLPPTGPFSEAMQFGLPLLRVGGEKGPLWLAFGGKHAPFGYVPAEARGMAARVFVEDRIEPATVPSDGIADRVVYHANVQLERDGSAQVELEHTLYGRYAAALRGALAEMSEHQVRDVIESRLVGHALHGARLKSHSILHLDAPEQPLVIRTTSHVPSFAQVAGGVLLVTPPFAPRLGQLAVLPARQTPLLLVESTEQEILLNLKLPPGARPPSTLARSEVRDGDRRIVIQDRIEGDSIVLDRRVSLPAGRVQIDAYPKFSSFARSADDALSSSIRVRL
jgi:tetratricopeptide (TPR) repeat protein